MEEICRGHALTYHYNWIEPSLTGPFLPITITDTWSDFLRLREEDRHENDPDFQTIEYLILYYLTLAIMHHI